MDHEWRYVTIPQELEDGLRDIDGARVIGIDTESDSFFRYQEQVCLIQITGDDLDLVVDPLTIEDLSPLGPMLADPRKVKVFHGADYDISSLKRDYGFEIAPVFDTMVAAQALGYEHLSLADLVEQHFSVKLDKKYQRMDWSRRPLDEEPLEYARLDSHFLPRLRDILWAEVLEAGREAQVREECELLQQREWTGHGFVPDDFLRISGAGALEDRAKRVLRALCVMRDGIASRKDRPHFKVMASKPLLLLATTAPRSREQLIEVLGEKHHVVRRYTREVLDAVRAGLRDREPLPRSRPDSRGGRRLVAPDEVKLFEALRKWRNQRSKDRGVAPGTVIPNAVLKEIAVGRPRDRDALARIKDLRVWQQDDFGVELLEMVKAGGAPPS